MTSDQQPSPTVDFLVRLRKIDRSGLKIRDPLILYTVIGNPGISGVEISTKLGLDNRSSVACGIRRLIREGYIEDHREKARKANPAVLHVLPAGLEFWEEIKP